MEAERHEEILPSAGSPSKDKLWGVFLGFFLFGLLGRLFIGGRTPFVAWLSPDTTLIELLRPYDCWVTALKPFALGWRLLRICGWTLLAVVGLPLSFYGFLQSNHNQHEVVPGLLYRSAQLPAGEFVSLAKQSGLRTVINLRGENVGQDWYDAQYRAAKELGVGFLNYRMSASRELTVEQMTELAQMLRDAPKPALIHCGSGSDRSGLACALFLLEAGHPPEAVADQLSLRFGHFPYLWSGSWAMDNSLKAYRESQRLPVRKLTTGGEN